MARVGDLLVKLRDDAHGFHVKPPGTGRTHDKATQPEALKESGALGYRAYMGVCSKL